MLDTSINDCERQSSYHSIQTLNSVDVYKILAMDIIKGDTIIKLLFFLIGEVAKPIP